MLNYPGRGMRRPGRLASLLGLSGGTGAAPGGMSLAETFAGGQRAPAGQLPGMAQTQAEPPGIGPNKDGGYPGAGLAMQKRSGLPAATMTQSPMGMAGTAPVASPAGTINTGMMGPRAARHGGGMPSPSQTQGILSRMFLGDARQANQYIPGVLASLFTQANTNGFDGQGQSAYLNPRLNAIDDAQMGAESAFTRNLQSRGLGDSSAMASGLGALYSQGATARSGALTGMYDAEQARQLEAQQQQRGYLLQLLGLGGQGAQIAGQRRQQDMEQQQLDSQGGFGEILGQLLGAAGGAAGMASGMGWKPFASGIKPSGMGSSWPSGGR